MKTNQELLLKLRKPVPKPGFAIKQKKKEDKRKFCRKSAVLRD